MFEENEFQRINKSLEMDSSPSLLFQKRNIILQFWELFFLKKKKKIIIRNNKKIENL